MRLNDPQAKLDGFFPEYDHDPMSSFRDVLALLDEKSGSTAEKGSIFEQLVKAFLEEDKAQSERFDRVWLWPEWPGNGGRHDTGIDVVARQRDSGDLVAIQCKFYAPGSVIGLTELNKFLAAYSTTQFSSGIFVSTSERWGSNAENALQNRDKPVVRWGPDVFEKSSIDWEAFSLTRPKALARRKTKGLREYQKQALDDVLEGFEDHDRGKLVMACGSGKTFTTLRVAERVAGTGGAVLFLTPSISLLSQALLDWASDADLPLKTFAVCSDTKAGLRRSDDEDISPYDLCEPASTDATELVRRFEDTDRTTTMSAVFSTYQSLDIVALAQDCGLPQFDLVICDEAHRTTGVKGTQLTGWDESNFQRVHDNGFIASKKRLYMTATPRIYGDQAKRKANENRLTLASMDDEGVYGPEFHRLGFGKAIEMGILSDYKVLIFDIDQEQVGIDLDELLSDSATDVNMDNGARMVGCWNGLRKRGADGLEFVKDAQPAKRAVAFSNTIEQSKLFEKYFPQVIESCIAAGSEDAEQSPLRCDVKHVDGTQHALTRSEHLAWLRREPDYRVCKVLTNARCLTEGIDVPALDAILFLQPRRSEIDVVQAVGRVMRRSPDKKFGYIILPIARPPNVSPQDTVSGSAYQAVWQVINAITAHDDRFEAKVNQLRLQAGDEPLIDFVGGTDMADRVSGGEEDEAQVALPLVFSGSAELRDAILARLVDKYSNPRYWEQWADRIREIAERHEARIRALLRMRNSGVGPIFRRFLTGLRKTLNEGITEDDAIGMLSQHLVTKPVFDALFEDYAFAEHNPVSKSMQGMIDSLQERGLEKETVGLEDFYRDVRIRAEGVTTAAGKQQMIAELYERFFRHALPEDVFRSLGIAYTPIQVADYIIHSVEDVLNAEFASSLGDMGVHVIDPFVGTGTFLTRVLQSGYISEADLKRKYGQELHANDIMLLAYYIATINIESTYHELSSTGEYEPFNGIVLTDTFQDVETDNSLPTLDDALFRPNNDRIERQKGLDIRVVVSNPPWSAANNREYPFVDHRVKTSYAVPSESKNVIALYDPYVKAIRLASDRVQSGPNGGIVALVTNSGFINSNAFDGFRKAVAEEFDAIHCHNLRGNARTAGEKRRREAGGVFGSNNRTGVAILLLVKRPRSTLPERNDTKATIYYHDIGDYLSREQKLNTLGETSLRETPWRVITPNEHGDWINQRSMTFATLRPLVWTDSTAGREESVPVFKWRMPGLKTNRDVWCFASSKSQLKDNVRRTVDFYNVHVQEFRRTRHPSSLKERLAEARQFAREDDRQFHWSSENYRDLGNLKSYSVDSAEFRIAAYRPFFKQNLYFNRELNTRIREFPEIFPNPATHNLGISMTGPASNSPYCCLMTDEIPESCLTAVNSVYFPRWRYIMGEEALTTSKDSENLELKRVSNITPQAVREYRRAYADASISEDDLFYYSYGVLHSEQWRKTFADDLA